MSIQKAYNSWSEQYDSNENKTRDLDKMATREILSNFKFKNVLELGCGTGKNTEWLVNNAEQIISVDFSQGMLDLAEKKIKSKKVSFLRTDLNQEWDIINEFADLITCSLTLEHIKNLDFIFSQAFQKLKTGGHFFICELHPFKQYTGSKAKYETPAGTKELDVFVHHISDYVSSAERNGFKLIKINEWFDDSDEIEIPRLISFVFEKYHKVI